MYKVCSGFIGRPPLQLTEAGASRKKGWNRQASRHIQQTVFYLQTTKLLNVVSQHTSKAHRQQFDFGDSRTHVGRLMMETKKVDKGTYRRQVDEIGSGTIPKLLK